MYDNKKNAIFILMDHQITQGIKISVKTTYNGTIYRGYRIYYAFSYFISIKNNSKDTIQLIERFWNIYDALNNVETVEGKGVVGQTPVLEPNDKYHYKSNCFLTSNVGAMNGFYKMVNIENKEVFKVKIPTFQLIATPVLN